MLTKIHEGFVPDNFELKLKEHGEDGNIIEILYRRVCNMVDNGYFAWSCTVPSVKDGVTCEVIRLFEWLESIWKDAENSFGILIGRFRILRYGFKF